MVASVDNVHVATGMWTIPEMVGRKPFFHPDNIDADLTEKDASNDNSEESFPVGPNTNGFAWLWHEAHTFEPYDVELSFRDTSLLPRQKKSAGSGLGVLGGEGDDDGDNVAPMSESATQQVLASVTQKAKRLFHILGTAQLANSSASSTLENGTTEMGSKALGISYDMLMVRAREEFLATTDTALRALLTEFRDHGLVRRSAAPSGGTAVGGSMDGTGVMEGGKVAGDVFWIPLTRNVLATVLDGLAI